ncbi:paraquat-inducible protein B [Hasllibacter halocynthiae]|uniref:Paraquat-inducible protein B n=1 Tax=Hasllibacter halocynthiae TaxID=595589 RepID=A0A2T0X2Z7_9RHOB|nr:MlaD family protein [Hasllibacter halocynthiae]PRY93308.1 paraquat-inducible protein B [Hasllibacter halocynthiae]
MGRHRKGADLSDAESTVGAEEASIAEPRVRQQAPRRRRRLTFVWLVPVVAVAAALWFLWQDRQDAGAVIRIAFEDASGVIAGETELRYRDVAVGRVESVDFTPDLAQVLITVRVVDTVAPYIDDDARFWIVSPEISAQGISGLDTVLSGVYLAASWDLDPEGLVVNHVGEVGQPLGEGSASGLRFTLFSSDRLPSANGPILYRGVEVGEVGAPRLDVSGGTAIAEAVIFAPYDQLVTERTRFWDVSGFDFSIGTSGAALEFDSISSLVSGGVTFDTLVSGGAPAEDGASFRLFGSADEARRAIFSGEGPGEGLRLTAIFEGEVSGLEVGAPVELGGLPIGEVAQVTGVVDRERFGDDRVRLQTVLEIRPTLLSLRGGEDPLEFLADRVEGGLRAQLDSASLFLGGLKVVLEDEPGAEPAVLDLAGAPFPTVPTVVADTEGMGASAESLFNRLGELPFEAILDRALAVIDGAARVANDPALQETPGEILGLVTDLRAVTASEEVQALPERIGRLSQDATLAVGDVRGLLASVREGDGLGRALEAVDAVAAAAQSADTAVEDVPALVEELVAAAEALNALPVPEIGENVRLASEGVAAIAADERLLAAPAALTGTLEEAQGLLAEARAARLVEEIAAAAQAASDASVAAEETVDEFSAAVVGLPALIDELTLFSAELRGLPLDTAVVQAEALLASVDAVVDQQAVRDLPVTLEGALDDLRAVTAELRAAGAVERLNEVLDAAANAAASVEAAAGGAPEVIENLRLLSEEAAEIPLEELVARTSALIATAEGVLQSPGVEQIPENLNGALAQVNLALEELREGGTVENVNALLASGRRAADGVAGAADDLPTVLAGVSELLTRADGVLSTAGTTLGAYGEGGQANRELLQALRDVQGAADALTSLARAIERRPNSLLLGR